MILLRFSSAKSRIPVNNVCLFVEAKHIKGTCIKLVTFDTPLNIQWICEIKTNTEVK